MPEIVILFNHSKNLNTGDRSMSVTTENQVKKIDLWINGERVAPASQQYFIDHNPEDDSA